MATVTGMDTAMAMRHRFDFDRCGLILAGLTLSLSALPAAAAEWTIAPSITVNETATDNVALVDNHRKSDLITDVMPGIRIDGKGDRVKLNFDYKLHNLYYAQDSRRNNTQNALNALGSLEALEDLFFIDANASIAQQSISAFRGTTSNYVNTNDDNNTTETRNYRLSPYFKGVLGGFADYELRYNFTQSSSDANNVYDVDTRQVVARLAGTTGLSRLGWALEGNTQKVEFGNGLENKADLLRGVLTYQFDPQFRVSLIGGRESNDYLSIDKKSHTIKGVGFEWAPTERTQFAVSREDRFFGNSNSISFSHRTAGTAWKYRETKDATSVPNRNVSGDLGTYFDLFDNLYASLIPDDATRAAFVNNLLQSNGISPEAQLQGGFLTSGVTLQHRRELSFALLGVRNTVTFAVTRSESENLSQGAGTGMLVGTDFANFQNIRQTGASINWSHKLSAISTLTGNISRLDSKGTGTSSLETEQKMFSVNFVTKLGPKTTAGLGARRVVFDGTTNYTENALTGSLAHQF